VLSVSHLSRVVAGRALVADLGFEMAAGEVVAVLGRSGSGKTSLLRLVAGFDAPTAGEVRLGGEAVSVPGRIVRAPEHRGLAVAFQDATLFPHLDAVDNAGFGIRGATRDVRRARARQALADMGLAAMDGRDVATLSGGEAQRVSLARALAAESRLLLLDEPFGNVDRLTRADLLVRLKAQLARGQAAIVVTHDPADAVELGARVLLLREGRLEVDAPHAAIVAGECGEWARSLLTAGT